MRLTVPLAPTTIAVLWISLARAHLGCRLCVPLDDLLVEAYGVEFSETRISSAIGFHNGSAQLVGSVLASQEYQDLMRPLLRQELDHEPRQATLNCPRSRKREIRYPSASPDDSYLYQLSAAVSDWWKDYKERLNQKPMPPPAPLHPTAQIFQQEFLKLSPFVEMTPEQRGKASIGLQVPPWMFDHYESCHLIAAAERTFGAVVALESSPSAAYTAAGYELCRVSYDAFECTGPGKLMVLEYSGDLIVLSLVKTPLLSWAHDPVIFSARRGATPDQLAEWIDDFIKSEKPDKIMLAGSNVQDPALQQALSKSHAGKFLETHPHLSPAETLIFGTAQEAKEALERQGSDCSEPERCLKLRRQADTIAGLRKWSHRPPRWARVRFDHEEL